MKRLLIAAFCFPDFAGANVMSDCEASARLIAESAPLLTGAVSKYSQQIDYKDFASWRVGYLTPEYDRLNATFGRSPFPAANYSNPVLFAVKSDFFGRIPLIAQSIQSTLRYGDKYKADISLHWQFAKDAGELFAKECPEQAASM